MKSFLLFFFLIFYSFAAQAHEYYFGFAEISFNAEESRYEGTLILSTHDLEEWLKNKGVPVTQLELQQYDEEMFNQMEKELFKGFKISVNGRQLQLQSIGFETLTIGTVHVYFQSEKTNKTDKIQVTFDLLMDLFPNQQNKLTFSDAKRSVTVIFLPNKTTSSITIK